MVFVFKEGIKLPSSKTDFSGKVLGGSGEKDWPMSDVADGVGAYNER